MLFKKVPSNDDDPAAKLRSIQVEVTASSYGTISPTADVAGSAAGAFKPVEMDSSFFVICLLISTGDTARGVLFPTLYGRVVEMGGNKMTQGLTVAAFSAGRVFASPYFGRWSESLGRKTLLKRTSLVIVAGGLLNAFSRSCWHLICAQVVTGVGSATLGVTRTYVTERTCGKERTWKTAQLTAVQYSGFTVTPFIGALFKQFLGDSDTMYGPFRVTAATCAAYFLTLLGALCWLCLELVYNDRDETQMAVKRKEDTTAAAARARAKEEDTARMTPLPVEGGSGKEEEGAATATAAMGEVDWCIAAGLLLNVATKGSIGVFETMAVPLATSSFALSPAHVGFVVSACGTVGVLVLFCEKPLATRFHDTKLMVAGVLVMVLACSLFVVPPSFGGGGPTFYFASIFLMYSVGYPIGHTAVLTWFGKLSKQASQGFLQGWFASAGSVGRIVLPFASGVIAEFFDYSTLFTALAVFLFLTWTAIVANYALFTRLTV